MRICTYVDSAEAFRKAKGNYMIPEILRSRSHESNPDKSKAWNWNSEPERLMWRYSSLWSGKINLTGTSSRRPDVSLRIKLKRKRIMEGGRVGGRGTWQHVEARELVTESVLKRLENSTRYVTLSRLTVDWSAHKALKTARIVPPLETIKAKETEAAYAKVRDYNVRNLQTGVEGCDSLDLAGSSCSTTRSTHRAFYLQLADIGFGQHHHADANKSPPWLCKIWSKASSSIFSSAITNWLIERAFECWYPR